MTPATPAQLKALFPAFAGVADTMVQAWLDRAARVVDESWAEADQQHAQMLLAAHYMTLNGLGTGAEAEMAAAGASGFLSLRSGALSIERATGRNADPGLAKMGEFGQTAYGRQFFPLLKANRGGVRVTSTGELPSCGYYQRPWFGW